MRRREFIKLAGSSATLVWPIGLIAQQVELPSIGFLHSGSANRSNEFVTSFRQGLRELGVAEGQNVVIEFRWADGKYDRLPSLAAELVSRNVAVIVTGGGFPSPLATKAATTSIPIVFAGGSDPIASGLVSNRPTGNITGILNFSADLTAKRLGLLHELVPQASMFGVLRNPDHPESAEQMKEIHVAAQRLGLTVHVADAQQEGDFESALASLAERRVGGLFVVNDPSYAARRYRLAALVARYGLPASYSQRQFVEAGGLMSYGTNFNEIYRQAGVYAARVLKGEKPADLPVVQPSRFELVINLGTAKALRLTVPNSMQLLADEVIE
jgi:putative ABC transport system substrate-binding protein